MRGILLKRFLLRFVLAYAVLTLLCVLFEKPLLNATAPLIRAGVAVFTPSLEVQAFSVRDGAVSALAKVTRLEESGLSRWFRVKVDVNARPLLVGPILTLCVLAAWKFRSGKARAWALGLGMVISTACAMQSLAVDIDNRILQSLGPPSSAMDQLMMFYAYVIDNGGRQVLGILAAVAGLALSGALSGQAVRPAKKAKPARKALRVSPS